MKNISIITLVLALLVVVLSLSGCYSCRTYTTWKGLGPVPDEVGNKFFWSKACRDCIAQQPEEPEMVPVLPAPKESIPIPAEKPQLVGECGPYTVTMNYPYGGSPIIRLEKVMPNGVPMNASFEYTVTLTNLTNVMVSDIVITEKISENFKYTSSSPAAEKDANKLVWKLESLDAGATQEIRIVGTGTGTDCLQLCATVTYLIPACANVQMVEPKLILAKTAPEKISVCKPIPVTFVVTNSGSGEARDVKIVDTLPEGLSTEDGKSEIEFVAGTLATGQSKQFSVNLKASKAGKYVNKAVASSSSGLKSEATTTTIVDKPVLIIEKKGPKLLYLGRAIRYQITVTNTGNAQAQNIIVTDTIPQGVTDVIPSDGGELSDSMITWKLGVLAPNASKMVSVTYTPANEGDISNRATAEAYCTDTVSTSASTSVMGIPAILLEVIDIEDPVEVGSETTYVITTTNQGSKPGTNIQIVCTLEDEEKYISSTGPTTGTIEGNTLTFAPLNSLEPKAKATWRVVAEAVKPGKILFKVSLTSEEFPRPVEEAESTNLYKSTF